MSEQVGWRASERACERASKLVSDRVSGYMSERAGEGASKQMSKRVSGLEAEVDTRDHTKAFNYYFIRGLQTLEARMEAVGLVSRARFPGACRARRI
eukprot:5982218-Pleurochrysis_carterae.AAC.4